MYNELYHYGIPKKSGRYPYGSGERPYQSEGGPLRRFKNRLTKKSDVKKKSQNGDKKELTPEERKDEALKSKSPTKIYKVKDSLSDQELSNILTRLNKEKQLKQLSAEEIEAGKKLIRTLDKAKITADKFLGYYDTINRISKIFNGNSGDKKEASKEDAKEEKSKDRKVASPAPEPAKSESKASSNERKGTSTPDTERDKGPLTGTVEGEPRKQTETRRQNEYYDVDAEWREYKPSTPVLQIVDKMLDEYGSKEISALPDNGKQLPAVIRKRK